MKRTMTINPTSRQIHDAFLAACRAELTALKAGNVHVHAAGHDMEAAQFEAAALAAAPHVANWTLPVGARIDLAVQASMAAAGCNTNLGIVLLCVPLAAAAEAESDTTDLRTRLVAVLDALTREDAAAVYRAIAHANPGGLGGADREDVHAVPTVTLKQAMALAAQRDRIANAYVTDYADVFDVALPYLARARATEADEPDAIANLHMNLLAKIPDSHIARKYGQQKAEDIQYIAQDLLPQVLPLTSPDARKTLLKFDADLKKNRINPGTTADFVVATLFAETIVMRGRHTAAV